MRLSFVSRNAQRPQARMVGRLPLRIGLLTVGAWAACCAVGGPAASQLGPDAGVGPSYGYQPYDDRNPTGFYHPHGMGHGHYYLTQKYHALRFRAFHYRKFRGS